MERSVLVTMVKNRIFGERPVLAVSSSNLELLFIFERAICSTWVPASRFDSGLSLLYFLWRKSAERSYE